MSPFENTNLLIKGNITYGHIRKNEENIKSLQMAKSEIELMIKNGHKDYQHCEHKKLNKKKELF